MSPRSLSPSKRQAATLIELLVVLGIGAVMISLLIPALHRIRATADRLVCQNQLRQISLAIHSYEAAGNRLPNATDCYFESYDGDLDALSQSERDPTGTYGRSTLFYELLPYIDEFPLYAQGDLTDPVVRATIVRMYICPANIGMANQYGVLTAESFKGLGNWLNRNSNAHCSYAANLMIFPQGNLRPGNLSQAFPDGTSNTVMLTERYNVCYTAKHGTETGIGWTMPGWGDSNLTSAWDWPLFGYVESSTSSGYFPNFSFGDLGFQVQPSWYGQPPARMCEFQVVQGPHPGAMVVALGDGSVRSVAKNMSLETWISACHPADGASPGSDW